MSFCDENSKSAEEMRISREPVVNGGSAEVRFTVESAAGKLNCSLGFYGRAGWRLQSELDGAISDLGAAQLLSYYLKENDRCERERITAAAVGGGLLLTAKDGTCVELAYSPFLLTFKNASGDISAQISKIYAIDGSTVVEGGLGEDEAVWGAGERFDFVNRRGLRTDINAIDKWAYTQGNSYMPIPILIFSRGSGLYMNRFERMTVDVGSRALERNTWQFNLPGAPCDLFVYTTDKPADVLYGYSLLTGFSPVPSEWSYGTVVCRYFPDFSTVDGVTEMAEAMKKNDFPWEAVIVEGFDASNKSGLKEMCDTVHALGKKIMLYSKTGRNMLWSDGDETRYFVKRASDGSVCLPQAESDNPEDNPNPAADRYFDITSEEVREYLFDRLWGGAIDDCGIEGSKVDFCEQFPDYYELDFADGQTKGAHHWYPVVFNTLLYNKLNTVEGGCMMFTRGGGIGAQRYPFVWMGDQKREFSFLSAQLKGILSSGLSGVPFTSFDMAGYKSAGEDEADVFIRAVEFTAFTGNIQTHGDVKRPYDFDEETKAIYRRYAKIHDALRPYLVEQGKISAETGLPLVRHLALSFWRDKNVWDIEDEYMLGESLLIAPILDSGTQRNIYLPEGSWISLWSGEEYAGGVELENYGAAKDEIPVFINAASVSPAFAECRDRVLNY